MRRDANRHRPWRIARRIAWRTGLAILLLPTFLILLFRFIDPPLTPLMLIRRAEGHGIAHQPVPLATIAPALRFSVIAAEDNRFCRHWGFDVAAMRGQIDAWSEGRRPHGASTITMQTAKNLFLWPGRDPLRKLLETWFTPQLELLWPKRRILEVYLNIVELGPGIYGAQAAAAASFAQSAGSLSPREAALLAAVLPAPLRWSAARPTRQLAARAALIQRRTGQLGPLLDCAR